MGATMFELALLLMAAAVVTAISMAMLILGFQCLTGFPFRWGWRRHAAPIGKLLPPPPPPPRRPQLRLIRGGRDG